MEKSILENSKRPSVTEVSQRGGASKISGSIIEATVEFQLENIFDKYSHNESNLLVVSEKQDK